MVLVLDYKTRSMKKIVLFVMLVLIFNRCEKPSDCIESFGETVTKEIPVAVFTKIKVYRGIEVVITEGPIRKVEIQAGANFIDNIEVIQNGNQLIFKDKTSCNWVRDYGQTKILITTPILEEIYSKTERNISSNGVLTFDNLSILSLDTEADGESGAGTGDFVLNLDTTYLTISNNNVSRFYLSGQTENATFNFYFGDGRIEAQDLIAQHINVFHRGSNDMIVYPVQSVTGVLNSTGNVVLKNVPPIVTPLDVLFTGHIVYP